MPRLLEKISEKYTLFSSIFTPQGKYLYEFLILKLEDGYLIESEKGVSTEIIKIFNTYKLRSKVNFIDVSEKYNNIVISIEKFKQISKNDAQKGLTTIYNKDLMYVDPRNKNLGAKIISRIEKNNYKVFTSDCPMAAKHVGNALNRNNIKIELHPISILKLAELIKDVIGYEGSLVFDTSMPDGNPRKLLDCSLINSYGWNHNTNLATGLEKTYNWYKNNIN